MGYLADSQATLEAKIRKRCGPVGADTTLFPAADLTEVLTEALAKLNNVNPRTMLSQITTVADTQDYRVAGDGYGLSEFRTIKLVVYNVESLGEFADEFVGFTALGPWSPIEFGLSVFDNPSLVNDYYLKVKRFTQAFAGQWSVAEKADGTYVRLIPAPSTAGEEVPYFWTQNRTLADLEAIYQEHLLDLAVGLAKQLIGHQIQIVPETSHGGFKTKMDGSKLIADGAKMEKGALAQLRQPRNPTHT